MINISGILVYPGWIFSLLVLDILVGGFVFFVVKYLLELVLSVLENRRLDSLIPSPSRSWIFGHMALFSRDQDGLFKRVNMIKDYPAMFCFYFGPFMNFVTVHHPDLAKVILTNDTYKSVMLTQLLKDFLGEGLLSSNGKKWKTQRHMLNPAFHVDVLKLHIDVFNETVKTTLEWLQNNSNLHEPCDIYFACGRLSFDNMARCIMSQPGVENDQDVRLIKNIKEIQKLAISRLTNPLFHSNLIFQLSSSGRKLKSLVSENDKILRQIVKERRELHMKTNHTMANSSVDNFGNYIAYLKKQKKKIDFLDLLLLSKYEDGSSLSETEILDQMRLFFVAGSETTGNTMTWLSYALSINQDWQDKCREEILGVCGDRDDISWEDISKLSNLHLCIKETLRLYPIAAFLGRAVHSPLALTDPYNTKKVINLKKGTQISICVFALHRHPEFWENPDVFDPERFTPERSKNRPSFAYIPFSASYRNCIGQNFAMYEIKVSFAHILRKYKLLPVPELPPPYMVPEVTLMPKDQVLVKVEKLKTGQHFPTW